MNAMGKIVPPNQQTREMFAGEDFINLCKALNIATNSIAQISELQLALSSSGQNTSDATAQGQTTKRSVPNSGRIILFTTAKFRSLDQIQDFLNKAIEECNKNVEQVTKNENA